MEEKDLDIIKNNLGENNKTKTFIEADQIKLFQLFDIFIN